MNNHDLKLVREKGSISVKTKELLDYPEDELKNRQQQLLYESGKYIHRAQRGIIRISKYEFYSTKENRLTSLKKHDLEITSVPYTFDYFESTSGNTKIWYLNNASQEAYTYNRNDYDSLEKKHLLEMPLLYKINKFLKTDY